MSYFKRLRKLLKLHFNLPKTLYFNFKVFGIKDALKLPVFLFGSIHLEGLYRGCVELQKIKLEGCILVEAGLLNCQVIPIVLKAFFV